MLPAMTATRVSRLASSHSREAETIAQKRGHYSDEIRDTFIAQNRQYQIRHTDDVEFLTQLQWAADWLTARKVLPGRCAPQTASQPSDH